MAKDKNQSLPKEKAAAVDTGAPAVKAAYAAKDNIRKGETLYKRGDTLTADDLGDDLSTFITLGIVEPIDS